MIKSARSPRAAERRTWSLKFLRSPLEALGADGRVDALRVAVNAMDGERVVDTGETELLPCQMLLRSIGYRGRLIDPSLPFDTARGVIPNTDGRVTGLPGVYVAGWIGTGPVGVIVNTMTSSFAVGRHVAEDLAAGRAGRRTMHPDQLLQLIRDRGARPVGFADWMRLSEAEEERGRRAGKPREKVVSVEEMRRIIWADADSGGGGGGGGAAAGRD